LQLGEQFGGAELLRPHARIVRNLERCRSTSVGVEARKAIVEPVEVRRTVTVQPVVGTVRSSLLPR
jgi:hypothetical protein